MKDTEFREWMIQQGLTQSTQDTQTAGAKRIEKYYGDIDKAFDADEFENLRAVFNYTKDDEAAKRANPTLIPIEGNLYVNLSHFRSTLKYYADFRVARGTVGLDNGDTDTRIVLFDDKGTRHWPVQQTNLSTGTKSFRIQGQSNRTKDAVESTDIIDIARALLLENRSVRMVGEDASGPNYLGYGKKKLTTYEISPNIAAILNIPERGSINGMGHPFDQAALTKLKQRFLRRFPDFEPECFVGSASEFFLEEDAYKRSALTQVQEKLKTNPVPSDEVLGGALLDILDGTKILGWRTNGHIAALRKKHPQILERAAVSLVHSNHKPDIAVDEMVKAIWPILSDGMDKSLPYSESRNIPSMLLAFIRPEKAIGINTHPMEQVFRQLTGKAAFRSAPLTANEYSEVLRFSQELFNVMHVWGWKPRDLWDVQSFIWIVGNENRTEVNEDIPNIEVKPYMANPTNLILYGPPGTGKTYNTASEAVRLCDGNAALQPGDRAALKARYDQLVEAGQISFVTFHQSYSYEDFVEGLRPVTGNEDGEESAAAGFRLEPRWGIFREISALAEQARKNAGSANGYHLAGRQFFKMSLGRAGIEDQIFDASIEGNYIVLGWGGEVDWSDARYDGDDGYKNIFDKWNEIEPGSNGNTGNISQLWRFRSSMREGDIVIIPDGNSRFRAIGEIVGPYEYRPTGVRTYNHRRAVKWLLVLEESLPVETIQNGKFTMRSCYLLKNSFMKHEALSRLLPGKTASPHTQPDQFVLIIDEINRANISKVFGELITLIEADKRLGEENAVTVKLPYSGDSFGVPNNLHILGTMNTADRSIALLDTALRRRFNFKELMPDPSQLSGASERTGLDLGSLLTTINKRIEFLFDREHQIGHSYFIHCKTLADVHDVMRHRVIPLLAEYFYEDWNKVAIVLGDAKGDAEHTGSFIKRTKLVSPVGMNANDFDEGRYSWEVCAQFPNSAYDQFA